MKKKKGFLNVSVFNFAKEILKKKKRAETSYPILKKKKKWDRWFSHKICQYCNGREFQISVNRKLLYPWECHEGLANNG